MNGKFKLEILVQWDRLKVQNNIESYSYCREIVFLVVKTQIK
ncbi:hypothetical protein FUSO4_10895 [Fusobacterium necrophorum DJ-1]|uniref:Uncharacterized protein n=2 Tax=Fusobacterium necrophorum TaxID=859 RepID=A0AB73BUA6_9FUSO|nr:hypothetical protein FUSO5_11820 [Fusobacterium necrophorum BFTR-1]KDE61834.1 hypothetical protein FUSO3_09660 [Fusobacterium necrophorum BL]KDE61895.1 hypothetical protein FUSO4_10895 [Fusobacterium necrophorum DJ-1]KDE67628.1 hypothetical protein FUSO6_10235 [Fusobacterium necrophorum DAB]KDE69732.1 hypothetical protein FUSO7_11310 [Fusobacterium necrophorum BFTR-2]KDE73404.1 hypothetical protein FUSO8_01670 [Fusobacterium necrophorum DJ-2]MBR8734723.1 hypothetical protein [Fusobacterium